MSQVRGIVMLIAAGVAFYRGWRMPAGHGMLFAYGLGALALGMAVWHLTRSRQNVRSRLVNRR